MSQPTPSAIAVIDFKDGVPVSDETAVLRTMVSGSDPILYDHTGKKTPFSVWLATRRKRLKKKFKHDRFARNRDTSGQLHKTVEKLPPNQYYIWVQ